MQSWQSLIEADGQLALQHALDMRADMRQSNRYLQFKPINTGGCSRGQPRPHRLSVEDSMHTMLRPQYKAVIAACMSQLQPCRLASLIAYYIQPLLGYFNRHNIQRANVYHILGVAMMRKWEVFSKWNAGKQNFHPHQYGNADIAAVMLIFKQELFW